MDREPILSLLLARREEAVGAMRTQFGKRLMMTAMNILNDREDAEETVSDTYLAVWNIRYRPGSRCPWPHSSTGWGGIWP